MVHIAVGLIVPGVGVGSVLGRFVCGWNVVVALFVWHVRVQSHRAIVCRIFLLSGCYSSVELGISHVMLLMPRSFVRMMDYQQVHVGMNWDVPLLGGSTLPY